MLYCCCIELLQSEEGLRYLNKQRNHDNRIFYIIGFFLCIIILALSLRNNKKISFDYVFLNILNNSIPGMKIAYGNINDSDLVSLNGMFNDSIVSMPRKLIFGPLTYMQLGFSGFTQIINDENYAIAMRKEDDSISGIKSFSDVPEGTIYFSEEDEYKAEEQISDFIKDTNDVPEGVKSQVEEEFLANLKPPNKIALSKKLPEILIYHSHATESYMPSTEGNYHTLNEKYNVVSVGKIMAKVLQDKYKYKVIHDKTYHDKNSYAYSYSNSLVTIKQQTTKNKSIKMILDIHRDGFTVKNDEQKRIKKNDYTITINGKKAARVMLVIGGANPNYKELEKFVAYVKKKMDKLYPGLYLKTDKKTRDKYNQYFSNYSTLIEIGCMLNTVDEAAYSAELMANVIGEVLKDLQE